MPGFKEGLLEERGLRTLSNSETGRTSILDKEGPFLSFWVDGNILNIEVNRNFGDLTRDQAEIALDFATCQFKVDVPAKICVIIDSSIPPDRQQIIYTNLPFKA